MRKTTSIVFILAAACCLSACRSTIGMEGSGAVKFTIIEDAAITDAVSPAVRSDLSSFVTSLPKAEDFTITVFHGKSELWSGLLPDWPVRTRLPLDSCSVTAVFDPGVEGCGKPSLAGSASFVPAGFDTTEVAVTVHLANCILKVGFSDSFRNYFPTAGVEVTTGAGNTFTFDDEGDEAVFIDAYRFSASCNCISQAGAAMELGPFEYDNLKAGVCYTLHFDVSSIGSVSVTVTVNLDDTAEEIDLGIIDLN